MRCIRWCLLLCLLCLSLAWIPARADPANVYVDATTNDPIGTQLVYFLRETLRGSNGMQLVDSEDDSVIQIRLVTLDPDHDAIQTVYSAVITSNQIGNDTAKLYRTNIVGRCGADRVQSCAIGLASDLDKQLVAIRQEILGMLKVLHELKEREKK